MFISGRATVIFIYQSRTSKANNLMTFLSKHNINPETYTAQCFAQRPVVYMKVNIDSMHQYIGFSFSTVSDREASRFRKSTQFKHDPLCNAEPFVKFLSNHNCFWSMPCFCFQTCHTKLQIIAAESQAISELQPEYNASDITIKAKFNKLKGSCTFKRLFRRTRRRANTEDIQTGLFSSSVQQDHTNIHILVSALCSSPGMRFTITKHLISRKVPEETIYAIRRVMLHQAQPFRGRGLAAMKLIIKKRNMRLPNCYRPLSIPFLAQDDFKHECNKFLRSITILGKEGCIPLNVPKASVVESRYPTIGNILHNYKEVALERSPSDSLCSCHRFKQQHPEWSTIDHHIVCEASSLTDIPVEFQNILTASSSSAVFPSEFFLKTKITACIKTWCKNNHINFPNKINMINNWVAGQIKTHKEQTQQTNRISTIQIKNIQTYFNGLIWHCADHEATNLILFCRLSYARCLSNTFYSCKDVFSRVQGSPTDYTVIIRQMVPNSIRKLIRKQTKHTLPNAFILPKRKKNFASGRPVIRYNSSPYLFIFRAAGRLFQDICSDIYKNNNKFGKNTVQKCLRTIKRVAAKHKIRTWTNQDLAGYFTSVPQQKLLQHAAQIIKTYADKHNLSQDTHFRVSCGKKYATSIKNNNINSRYFLQINLRQLQDTIKFALQTSFFRVGSITIKQSRGSGIGNPMSPMLCEGSILATECRWRASDQALSIIPVRYVDNLFSLQLNGFKSQTQLFAGWDSQFYNPPISLEQCEVQDEYLGCRLFLSQGILNSLYVVRTESWRYPHSASAGTNNRLTTGLHSRLHAAHKLSWPKHLQVKAVNQLTSLYIKLGHNKAYVNKIVNKFKAKYKLFDH